MAEWYRKTTWTKTDEEEFWGKIKRSRSPYNKSQFIRLQAYELYHTKKSKLVKVAELLLLKLLAEYRDDSQVGSAYDLLGNIYCEYGDFEKAISYYKDAIDFESVYPNSTTNAYLNYSELIVKNGKIESYNYVEELLEIRLKHITFPFQFYTAYSILSIINKHNGNIDKAVLYAALANDNAAKESSGFRYHKTLGLVTERDRELDNLVTGKTSFLDKIKKAFK